jgi:hypothetical protein
VAPYSRIDCLVPYSNFFYSDSLSALSEQLIIKAIEQQNLPVKKVVSVVGRSNQEALDGDYEWIKKLSIYEDLTKKRLPAAMHAFLSTQPCRYAMLVYSEGFVWSRRITLEEDQRRYESNIWLLVADVRSGRLVFFNKSTPEEADPLSERDITRRITNLLKEFKGE